MVNDMLNISRIESGRLSINITAVDIQKLAQDVIDDVQPRAQELGIHVLMDSTTAPPLVLADSDKIKEVMFNIVGNSLKFTPKDGTVTLSFTVTNTMVEVKVKDTGTGLEADDLPKLFQKFGLLPGSYVTNQAALGTGLGLYICKSIIELHEGKIYASSPGRGKGAEFVFTLKIFNEIDLQRLSDRFAHDVYNAVDLIHSQV
jgi:signal transduction histidine kinase